MFCCTYFPHICNRCPKLIFCNSKMRGSTLAASYDGRLEIFHAKVFSDKLQWVSLSAFFILNLCLSSADYFAGAILKYIPYQLLHVRVHAYQLSIQIELAMKKMMFCFYRRPIWGYFLARCSILAIFRASDPVVSMACSWTLLTVYKTLPGSCSG